MSRSTLAPRTRSFTELSTDRNHSVQSNRLQQTVEQRRPADALRAPLTAHVRQHRDQVEGMTTTFRLTSLDDALKIATTLTKSWFRGHSRPVGQLAPRLFRDIGSKRIFGGFRPELEMATIEEFKRHAALIAEWRLPPHDDRLGWLCVMQHFRTPTRLLDWSENLMVALYFAVSADASEDAEVWAMLPWALNEAAGAGYAIPLPGSRVVKYLLEQPYWNGTGEALATSLGLPAPMRAPIAIDPPMLFPRMAVQAGTFTIHPLPDDGATIADLLPNPRHLVRYIIPAGCKEPLCWQLRAVGFSQRHLFPDLEGLSRTIVFDNRVVGYSPPDPPPCSGLHPIALADAAEQQNTADTEAPAQPAPPRS